MLMSATQIHAGTLADISRKQAEADAAELDAKAARARADANSPGGAGTSIRNVETKTPSRQEDIHLNAIFGIGSRLAAEVTVNGATVTFRAGEAMLGWQATKILPHEMWLLQLSGQGAGKTREGRTLHLMLVGGDRDRSPTPMAPTAPAVRPMPGLPLPEMMPVPGR